MKKLIFLLSLVYIFVSCSNEQSEQKLISQKLEKWNTILYEQPGAILDSLNKMSTSAISVGNQAYHNLLYTIAYDKVHGVVKNDSLISSSLAWYKKKKDNYNLCRSLLYKGIVLYNNSHIDSSSYYPIKEAEELYHKNACEDKYLGSQIFIYLGKIYRVRNEQVLAEAYIKKSIELSTSINCTRNIQVARLELFWIYLSKKQYTKALENIITFGDSEPLAPDIEYNLYNALSSYYLTKKEYNISIEYVKKMLKVKDSEGLVINYPKLYYSLANYFKRGGNLDSVLFYSKLAVISIKDNYSLENHFYYKYLAEVYLSRGDYKNALENYRKGYVSYILVYSKNSRNKFAELEKKYDLSLKNDQLSKAETNNGYLLNIVISLILLVILMFLVFRLILKRYNEKIDKAEKQILVDNAELKKAWLVNEVQKVSTGLLPLFLEEVSKEAARSRKISKEVFDNLSISIDNMRTLSRNKITTIAKNDTFGLLNPNLDFLTELSDFEKIILVLIDNNYSVQEIAELLNTTPSSVRSIKTKIKEKIIATEKLPFDPTTTFTIFK